MLKVQKPWLLIHVKAAASLARYSYQSCNIDHEVFILKVQKPWLLIRIRAAASLARYSH
jgi:hypothetical protein